LYSEICSREARVYAGFCIARLIEFSVWLGPLGGLPIDVGEMGLLNGYPAPGARAVSPAWPETFPAFPTFPKPRR